MKLIYAVIIILENKIKVKTICKSVCKQAVFHKKMS